MESYGCGGVLGVGINGHGQPSGGGYPRAREDRPFKQEGDVIIHRKSGKIVAQGSEQCAAFFTGRQIPKHRKVISRNSVSQEEKSPHRPFSWQDKE